jgi:hypothetical protein
VQDLKIMIVGPLEFLSPKTRRAWGDMGIELLGPFTTANVDLKVASTTDGLVIDITNDADATFKLSEELEALKIPFLYALGDGTLVQRSGPFVLNGRAADIQAIVNTLLTEGDVGTRH